MSLVQKTEPTVSKDLNYELPTDDLDVRSLLRSLEEPITLFGEDKLDRRARLIQLISQNTELYQLIVSQDLPDSDNIEVEEEEEEEEYYEPVSEDPVKCDELYDLRVNITNISLQQAKKLNEKQLKEYDDFNMVQELVARRDLYDKLSKLELCSSKIISNRPISKVKFHQDKIITTSWSGELKIFEQDDELTQLKIYKETDKISRFDVNQDLITTGNFAGDVNFYNGDNIHKHKLHELRISDLKIHPLVPSILITSSFDKTFQLFDITRQESIYTQFKAHSKEIFSIAINPQGSLLSTCGLDSVLKIWDLRSGKVISSMFGHQDGIYCNDWHQNGHQLVTGSGDCTLKIWDMRNPQREMVSVPRHDKLISSVKISDNGKWMVSSSYDHQIGVTSFDNFMPLLDLKGHDDKIIDVDIQQGTIISCGWDKSLKIWN